MSISFEYYNILRSEGASNAFQLDGNVTSFNEEWINSLPREANTIDEYKNMLANMRSACITNFSFFFTEFVPGVDLLANVHDRFRIWHETTDNMIVVIKCRNSEGRVYKTLICDKLLSYDISDSYVVNLFVNVLNSFDGDETPPDSGFEAGGEASVGGSL